MFLDILCTRWFIASYSNARPSKRCFCRNLLFIYLFVHYDLFIETRQLSIVPILTLYSCLFLFVRYDW